MGQVEAPPTCPGLGMKWRKARPPCLISAYHKLGDFSVLDARRRDLKEQLDPPPAALLLPPVLLQLRGGHAGVGAGALVRVWRDGTRQHVHQVSALWGQGSGEMAGSVRDGKPESGRAVPIPSPAPPTQTPAPQTQQHLSHPPLATRNSPASPSWFLHCEINTCVLHRSLPACRLASVRPMLLTMCRDGGLSLSVPPAALTRCRRPGGLGALISDQRRELVRLLRSRLSLVGPSPLSHLLCHIPCFCLHVLLLLPQMQPSCFPTWKTHCFLDLMCAWRHANHLWQDLNPSPPKCPDHCAFYFKGYGAPGPFSTVSFKTQGICHFDCPLVLA